MKDVELASSLLQEKLHMAIPAPRRGEGFTYGDYITWPEDERWELIEGIPYAMTPAPATRHQAVSMELAIQFGTFLRGKPCRAFSAPFDVRFPDGDEPDEKVKTVVQPDLAVICDLKKLDRRGCRGGPDFVLEITSPSTAAKDQNEKVRVYEKGGVREYWILDPERRMLTIRVRGEEGKFGEPQQLEASGRISVAVLPGMEVDFDLVFREADVGQAGSQS